jgi:hypothetical protein
VPVKAWWFESTRGHSTYRQHQSDSLSIRGD